ncbi:MAG: serpin family protein [Candidatus Brocadiia bacterium]
MDRIRNIVITGLTVIVFGMGMNPVFARPKTSGDLPEGNNAFAVALYEQLRQNKSHEGENLFLSPFSVSTAFALAYAGARGETAEQMEKVLHFPCRGKELNKAFAKLIDNLNARQKRGNYNLSVANALWGQKGYDFRKAYLSLTQKYYNAGLKEVDFKNNTEPSRKRINKWVAQETQNKIKKLMPRGSIDRMTRLVLTNAIYFKARWAETFNESATRKEPFILLDGTKVKNPMMHQTETFGYRELDDLKILEMPYTKHELSMVVLLPKEDDGLPKLEESLTEKKLAKWLKRMGHPRVTVAMPKFKLETKFMLGDTLKKMGMVNAFQKGKANFSGMNGRRDLYIQAAIHKAYVDVYEEGTEAAAATGIAVGATAAHVAPPKKFIADHPFLFLIRDRKTNSILFMGRLMDPTK